MKLLILPLLSLSFCWACTQGQRRALRPPPPFNIRSGVIRELTDDGNSDDEQMNQPAKMARDATKIVERFGSCHDKKRHKCLWYKMQVHTKHSGDPPAPRMPCKERMQATMRSMDWRRWINTAASPEDRRTFWRYSGRARGVHGQEKWDRTSQSGQDSSYGWKTMAGQSRGGQRNEWLRQSLPEQKLNRASSNYQTAGGQKVIKQAIDSQNFEKFMRYLKRKMASHTTTTGSQKKEGGSYLDRNLQQDDPQFIEYMKKRFYLLKNAQKYIRGMKKKMHGMLKLHQEHDCKEQTKAISGGSKKLIAHIDKLLRTHRSQTRRVHQKHCRGVIVHFLHDVDRVLNHMQKKQSSYEDMMKTWLQLSYQQKQELYRILLANQMRDMHRVLRLRNLEVWYSKKVHLLDLQTRQRLQQIIRALKLQEQQFQDALWERLKHLQQSADEWTKHEATYKRVLLEMSRQQKLLMEMNLKQSQQIQRLSEFTQNIPTRCGMMGGSVGEASVGRSMGAMSMNGSMGSTSMGRSTRLEPATSTGDQDECNDYILPPAAERRQNAIVKQLKQLKIRRHGALRSKMCAIRSIGKTLAKPLNDDDKKVSAKRRTKKTRKTRKKKHSLF
ncbi:hypothetical protein PSACC_01210 [Paramicrosporidium saccamoebae]|uniref:Uncharacterized protein n=1 Tax=Paramicrosporidium saccamoebae TaxID=1246581 RepID=A0A2H9TMV0_9FUNG|nr:hypothetical protein PSACC_01210 [Paramicrosporidium saccamoebae]